MPRKRYAAVVLPGEGENDDAAEAKRSPLDMEVDEVLATIGADRNAVILLHKESTVVPGRMDWVATMAAGTLNLDALRNKWGGGKYTLRIRDPKTGKYGMTKTFSLAEPLNNGQNGGLAGGMNPDFMQALLLKLVAPPAPPPDPTPLIIALAGVFKPTVDPMEVAAKIAQMMRPEKSEGSSIDVLLKGVELGKQLEGITPESSVYDVVKEMGPPIVGLLGKIADRSAAPPAPAGTPHPVANGQPTTPAVATLPAGAPPAGEPVNPYKLALDQLVPELIQWATADKDPELRAHVLMEDVKPWVVDLVAAESQKPTFMQEIFAAYPQLAPHRQWVTEFLTAIREYCTPEDEPAAPKADNGVEMGE